MQEARADHAGLTVRYEDLTTDPDTELQRICEFVGAEWEEGMLAYGDEHTRFGSGLGDWSDKLRTGAVQPARPLPPDSDIPPMLRDVSAAWGYLSQAPRKVGGVHA